MRVIVLAMLLMVMSGPGWAEKVIMFFDGNKLHTECNIEDNNYYSSGFCQGYIIGVLDVMRHNDSELFAGRLCISQGVQAGQFRDVVKAWLTKHPESRNFTAASIIARALSDA